MSMPSESQPMGGVQSSPAYADRNASFAEGHQMSGPTVSPGLQQQQSQENAQQPRGIRPALSANGMSQGTYSATMGGQFPTQNAMAEDQYSQAKFLMHKSD